MEFLTKENSSKTEIESANDAYEFEYKKARGYLPKKFLDIYENHNRFHDAKVPEISIITKYKAIYVERYKFDPTIIRLVIIDYLDNNNVWEVNLYKVRSFYSNANFKLDFFKGIEFFMYDEILLLEDEYLSWEIYFSSDTTIKTVFKELKIRKIKIN